MSLNQVMRSTEHAIEILPSLSKNRKADGGTAGRGKNKKQRTIPPHQVRGFDGKVMIVTESRAPLIGAQVLNTTNKFDFIVETQSIPLWKKGIFKFTISNTHANDVHIAPIYEWFDRLEIIQRSDSVEIQRISGDAMRLNVMRQSRETLRNWARMMGYDDESFFFENSVLAGNTSRDYYLILPGLFLDGFGIDLGMLRSDLLFSFYPKGDIRCTNNAYVAITNPTAAEVTLTGLQIIVTTENMSPASKRLHLSHLSSVVQQTFLDTQTVTLTKLIAPSSEIKLELDDFHHNSAFLAILIRKGVTNYDSALEGVAGRNLDGMRYVSVGPKATFDHVDSANKSQLGGGTGLSGEIIRQVNSAQLFGNDYAKNNAVYVIPYSHNMRAATVGVVDGFHSFQGDNDKIRIVTDTAEVIGTFVVTSDNTYAGGTLRIGYKGSFCAVQAPTVTAANLAIAINAIPTLQKEGLHVSGAQSALLTADPGVFTFSVYGRGGGAALFNFHDFAFATPTIPTGGDLAITAGVTPVLGCPASATYTVSIISYFFRHVNWERGILTAANV
jgi:hypothetical protein